VVLIPKKKGTQKCEEYRTLNLITHASKIITRIIKNRIDKKIEENLGKDQFGFRKKHRNQGGNSNAESTN